VSQSDKNQLWKIQAVEEKEAVVPWRYIVLGTNVVLKGSARSVPSFAKSDA
jgi:hypothetical protein